MVLFCILVSTANSVAHPLPRYESSACNPVFGASSEAAYQFCALHSDDLLQRLSAQLLLLDGTAQLQASPQDHCVVARLTLPGQSFDLEGEQVRTPGAAVQLAVQVFLAAGEQEQQQAGEEGSGVVVVFSRKEGAITAFQSCFCAVRDHFLAELHLTALSVSGDKQLLQEEELELSEDLGMI